MSSSRWHEGFYNGVLSALSIEFAHSGIVDHAYGDIVEQCGGEKLLRYAERIEDAQVPNIREALRLRSQP